MEKHIIFLSHIHEEKLLAVEFKNFIESYFQEKVEVFVASDERNIPLGREWLHEITQNLKRCSILILLCSLKSIQRTWINFEAGVGWAREIPTIPLCHSGMKKSILPNPLNMLQSANISDKKDLSLIIKMISKKINFEVPNVDFNEFIQKVPEFEKNYTFWDKFNEMFSKFPHNIISKLKNLEVTRIVIPEKNMNEFINIKNFFTQNSIFKFITPEKSCSGIGPQGPWRAFQIVPLDFFKTIFDNPDFKF